MNTFEITIQRKAETWWPVVVELGGEKTPLVVRDDGWLELDLQALSSQVTPRDYGILLGQTLFRDAIREAFLQARAESEDHLSVLLFVEDSELCNLHWERLCAPLDLDDRWDFLALDQRASLTLSVPSRTHRFFRQIGQRDLRALVVVASPQGLQRYQLAPFDVETVVSNVRTALGGIPCDVLATTPNAVGPPTLDELCARLTMASYTLLHIVCHGRHFPDSGETVLYLADEHNQVEPVEGSRLLERLREVDALPHFVFLATCESASPQAQGALGGLAQRLVRELGLPAVLAMTEQVSITTAQALASQFYPQLLQAHGYLSVALVEACAGLAERPDVTVPVLYSRLGAHPLFEQQVTLSTTSLDQQDRVNLIKALGKAYREALESSLQGVAEIALTLHEQLDLPEAPQPASWKLPRKERLLPEGTSILDVYDDASNGLLLLGNPGAGKSTLLYKLAHALLTRAAQEENHPLPVVLNLSLWSTKRLPLEDWIVEQLELRYYVPRKLGQSWQQEGRWLLLLDGLDEVVPSARVACVEAINTYLTTRTHLVSAVVCSRLEEYETLSKPLALQRVVVVQPLTPEQVATYLNKAGRSLTAVREVVRSNPVLNKSLTTPLMLNVAALAYKDKAVEDLPQIGTVDEQQRHIFASYLQRMLPAAGKQSPPSARKMQHSLAWLARQMRQRSQSILYLEQLQPDWLPAGWAQQVYTWLGVRIPAILIGCLVSLIVQLVFFSVTGFFLISNLLLGGVVGGLLGSTPAAYSAVNPSRTHPHLLSLLAKDALLGLGVGLGLALLSSSFKWGLLNSTITGVCFGLVTALLTLLFVRWPPSSYQATNPAASGSRTRKRFWGWMLPNHVLRQGLLVGGLFGLSYGLSYGLIFGLGGGLLVEGLFGLSYKLSGGLLYGLLYGLSYGLFQGLAWGLCGVLISLLLVHIPTTIVPTEILVWSWKRLWHSLKQGEHTRNTLMLALVIGLRVGLIWGLSNGLQAGLSNGLQAGLSNRLSYGLGTGLSYWLSYGLGTGLSAAGSYWLLVGLFQGVASTTFQELQRTIPNQGIHRSGRNGLFLGLLAGSIAAVIGGGGILMSYGLSYGMSYVLLIGLNEELLIGLNGGLLIGLNEALSRGCQIGLAVGLLVTLLMGRLAWWRHWLLRLLLWRSGAIPWRYVPLLDEAAQRILLRKVGGGYCFIHDLFRDYLATLEAPEPGGSVVQGVRDDD